MRVDVKYIISINLSWAAAIDLLNLYVNFIFDLYDIWLKAE